MTVQSLERGSTLVEVLVASGLLITLVGGLAQLLVGARRAVVLAERSAAAVLAAHDRLEGLRAIALTWDVAGTPYAGDDLLPSPVDALDRDVDGYSDVVDLGGRPVDDPGAGAARFVRRWAVIAMGSDEPAALALEVCVFDLAPPMEAPLVCLATVRARQP
jgi:hypothetical protein